MTKSTQSKRHSFGSVFSIWLCLRLALYILLGGAGSAYAQANYSFINFTPTSGTVSTPNATLSVGLTGYVKAISNNDDIRTLQIIENGNVLNGENYTERYQAGGENLYNDARYPTMTVNLGVGVHSLILHSIMGQGGQTNTNSTPFTITVTGPAATDNAQFISQSVPTPMITGQAYAMRVTMKNTGTTTWTSGSSYLLGSQNAQDNVDWGFKRVSLPTSVAPGAQADFNFNVTAPNPGVHNFQWQMLQEGAHWFGDLSTSVPVTVNPVPNVDNAYFANQSVPTSMVAGQSYTVSVQMLNNGTTTWTPGTYMLGSQNPQDNRVWNTTARATLPGSIAPGQYANISFSVTAPLTPGTYSFQWRMVQSGTWFGATSDNVSISVNSPAAPTATLASPLNNGGYQLASGPTVSVPISGAAEGANGGREASIVLLEVLDGTQSIYSTTNSSLSTSQPMTAGNHAIRLRAKDNFGNVGLSSIANITVFAPALSATLSSPANGSNYQISSGNTAAVPIAGSGTPGGSATIAKLEILDGMNPTPVYTTTSSSFSTSIGLVAGSHALTVRATDSVGTVSLSAISTITVTAAAIPPPTATLSAPADGTVLTAIAGAATTTISGSAAASGSLSIIKLELLDNGGVISTVTTSSISVSQSLTTGAHALQLRATDSNQQVGLSAVVTVTVNAGVANDGAQFGSQSVPTTMRAGQPYSVTVTMKNTGTTTWTDATHYRLGAQNPQDNRIWNDVARAHLSGSVATGQDAVITIPITAPQKPGNYNFQWQMLKEDLAWFGDLSTNVAISVTTGPGPTATLTATSNNVRVTGVQTATVTFTGNGTESAGTVTKLELFQGDANGYAATPVRSATGAASTLNLNTTVDLGAGVYHFKLRSTDSAGIMTDSAPVMVNVTNSALLGTISGIRVDATSKPQLVGWACQPASTIALNYQVILDWPTVSTGGTVLTSGTANVATEPDNAAVQLQCATPGVGHHFVVDLSTYTAQYAGRAIFVVATSGTDSEVLPCADNLCTMPGSLRIGLTTPANGDRYNDPATVFMQAKLSNGSGPYDEIAFNINGEWIAGTVEAVDTYFANKAGLTVSPTPYSVYAKVRQGSSTIFSVQNLIYIDANTGVSLAITSPSTGAAVSMAAPIPLAVAASIQSGSTAVLASVKIYANGQLVGTAINNNNVWSTQWTATQPGAYALTARAFDGTGKQLSQSPVALITVNGSQGATSPNPIEVIVDVPHLSNENAGTLPGSLEVGNDGAATYSIPLPVPKGTGEMEPKLSLNYSSLGNNGMVGLGWSLSGLSTIHRCAKTAAQDGAPGRISLNNADRLCLDGQRLMRVDGTAPAVGTTAYDDYYWGGAPAQYRTEQESFTRVTKLSNGGYSAEFKDGRVNYYGNDTAGAIIARGVAGSPYLVWAVSRIEDRSGNYMTVDYNQDATTGEYTPKQIRYGSSTRGLGQAADLAVRFFYEPRTDAQIQYMGGARNDLRTRLTNVQTFIGTATDGSGGTLVRDHAIHYTPSTNSGRSLVDWMQACATNLNTQASECLPKTTFDWGVGTAPTWKSVPFDSSPWPKFDVGMSYQFQGDLDGSGRTSFITMQTQGASPTVLRIRLPNGQIIDRTLDLSGLAFPIQDMLVGDLNGDGRDDLVFRYPGVNGGTYCLNTPLNDGTPNFACQAMPNSYFDTMVDLRNDKRMHLVAFTQTGFTDCSLVSGAMQCNSLPVRGDFPAWNPDPRTRSTPVPVDLSKQDMSDFYRIPRTYEPALDPAHPNSSACGTPTANQSCPPVDFVAYVNACVNQPDGLTCKNITRVSASSVNGPYLSRTASVGDLNGDGLTDFIYITFNWAGQRSVPVPSGGTFIGSDMTTTVYVCLSKETGMDCKQDSGLSPYSLIAYDPLSWPTTGDENRHKMGDFIGDGVNRLFFTYKPDPTNLSSAKSVLCRYTTTGFSCQEFAYSEAGSFSSRTALLDGSGVPAFLAYQPYPLGNYSAVTLVGSPAQDKIIGVTNGARQREEVDYARGDDASVYSRFTHVNGVEQRPAYPQVSIPAGEMVKELRRSTGQGNWLRSDYYYEGALSDATGRGSLGFGLVRVTDSQTNVINSSYLAQGFPYTGMITHSTSVHNGVVLNDTTNTPNSQLISQANGSSTFFAYISHSDVARSDLSGDSFGNSSTDSSYTDGWGNLTQQTIKVTGGGKTFTNQTTTAFNNVNTIGVWLIGLPNSVTVNRIDSDPSSGSASRTTGYTYVSGTPLLQSETVEAGTPRQVVTTFDRSGNVFGLVNKKIQAWTNPSTGLQTSRTVSDVAYDPKGRFPATVKNALSHSETRTYDSGSGAQKTLIGPNLLLTTWLVDGFGRVTSEQRADGNLVLQYRKQCDSNCPSYATVATITDTLNGGKRIAEPQIVYSDSAGHVVRNMTWGFDGRVIYIDQAYDNQGQLSDVYQPRFDTDSAQLARHQDYDDLHRVTKVTTLDEGGQPLSTITSYQGLVNVITNPKQQQRTDTYDVLTRVVQVVDAIGGNTSFRYEPFGNLSYTKDPNGNEITVTYDNLGRKTDLHDPNLGWIHYDVDPVGRTWRQVSPVQRVNGRATTFDFDAIDRMIARHEFDLESRWTFDSASMGKGKLAEAYTLVGGLKDYDRKHTYDILGRPSNTTQNLNGVNYSSLVEYDLWSRVIRNTYQRGTDTAKVYESRYSNTGYLARIERGNLWLWQVTSQDAANRVTVATLGNGLTDINNFNRYSGRLEGRNVQINGSTDQVKEIYLYDAIGNVAQRTQYWNNGGFIEVFGYDGLNRLSSSQVGSLPQQVFSYDFAGNLKTKTDTGNYTYPAQGSGAIRPHAVQNVSSLGTFNYDDNGNLLNGANRIATWNSFDMPISIKRGSVTENFVYGPEHQRIRQDRNDGTTTTTVYYAGAQEVEISGSTTKVKTYWPNGVGVEIDNGTALTELNWIHKDRLGSPIAISSVDGTLKERLAYDAWGRRRTLDGSAALDYTSIHVDNRGFTGHEMLDQVELVHMNGRVYDPITARFVSGDLLIGDPVNGQNYNRYSYVLNNPTNLIDPTGFYQTVPIFGTPDFMGPFRNIGTTFSGGAQQLWTTYSKPASAALQRAMPAARKAAVRVIPRVLAGQAADEIPVVGQVIGIGFGLWGGYEILSAGLEAVGGDSGSGENSGDAISQTPPGTTNAAGSGAQPPEGGGDDKKKEKPDSNSGKEADPSDKSGELTRAGRALQKHGSRPGSAFPSPKGNPEQLNEAGQKILDRITNSPNSRIAPETNRFGGVDMFHEGGQGARFDSAGTFKGFLEPPR